MAEPTGPCAVPTRVRVAHGDVRFAASPVLVGHYAGDSLLSAEAALDAALDGRITQCVRLGLYPGPLETCRVIMAEPDRIGPPGVVAVGLGEAGRLTVADLTRAIVHAALTFALVDVEPARAVDRGVRSLALSTLLVGSGSGGLSVAESVQSVLNGVHRANDRLRSAQTRARIADVEIVELWQDRALLAVRAVQDALATDGLRHVFEADARLRLVRGGRRRPVFSEPPGWWQRVHVDAQPDGSLTFEAPEQLAGTAVRTVATQRRLVDHLVTKLVDSPTPDPAAARTLYELLLPSELKERATSVEDVVLVVDADSARYPWELLHGAWVREDGRPTGIERGMVRQLTSSSFRSRMMAATGKRALVIGDTDSGLAPLPGAQKEAGAVTETLQEAGYTCTTLVRLGATRVVQEMFAQPFRLIHIAAHGVRDLMQPEGTVTGVVLGDGMFLTAAEVAQLAHTPDLVFVNCCYLGAVGPEKDATAADPTAPDEPPGAASSPLRGTFHLLAASLARELIDAGVRAVVVAGWAVEDAAAATFAQAFYQGLTAKQPIGQAVTEARVRTWTEHPTVNTWAAFQCYADPAWQLEHDDSARPTRGRARPFACLEEVEAGIANLTQSLHATPLRDLRGADSASRLNSYCDDLRAGANGEWLDHPRVQMALARGYAEAGAPAIALDWFNRIGPGGQDGLTIGDLEFVAALRVRLAWQELRATTITPAVAAERADCAVATLTAFLAGSGLRGLEPVEAGPGLVDVATAPGVTLTRLWRLGLAYQRRAVIGQLEVAAGGGHQARDDALVAMASCYRAALALPAERGGVDPPEAGVVAQLARAELALEWAQPAGPAVERLPLQRLEQALQRARQDAHRAASFWRHAVCLDLELLVDLHRGRFDGRRAERFVERCRLMSGSATPEEHARMCEGIDFLVGMAVPGPATQALLEAAAALCGASSQGRRAHDEDPTARRNTAHTVG